MKISLNNITDISFSFFIAGVISYFRIGCVPQDKVDALFEQAKQELTSP